MNASLRVALTLLLAASCSGPEPPPQGSDTGRAVAEAELEVGGTRVRFLSAGPTDAPVVLLLHGGRFRGSDWLAIDTPGVLAEAGFRVIAPDLPGFGDSPESPVPRDAFLARFLDELGVETCVVVTPSMSGSFALPFAAGAPERISGLVALAPVSIERWAPQLAPDTPALLVWGTEDRTIPLMEAERLRQRLPHARLELLERAGHPAYFDQPDRFHELLLEFLRE